MEEKNHILSLLKCMDGSVLSLLKWMDGSIGCFLKFMDSLYGPSSMHGWSFLKYMDASIWPYFVFLTQSSPTRFWRSENSVDHCYFASKAIKQPIWNRMSILRHWLYCLLWVGLCYRKQSKRIYHWLLRLHVLTLSVLRPMEKKPFVGLVSVIPKYKTW